MTLASGRIMVNELQKEIESTASGDQVGALNVEFMERLSLITRNGVLHYALAF